MKRLDRVQVATARDVTEISWDAREQLLERVRKLDGGDDVVRRFRAVGTSQPVKLGGAGKRLVLAVVESWLLGVGYKGLPSGMIELRNALVDDRDRGELDSGDAPPDEALAKAGRHERREVPAPEPETEKPMSRIPVLPYNASFANVAFRPYNASFGYVPTRRT